MIFLIPKTPFLSIYLFLYLSLPLSSNFHLTLPLHLLATCHPFSVMAIFLYPITEFSSLYFSSKFHLTLPPHLSVTQPSFPRRRIFYRINTQHSTPPPVSFLLKYRLFLPTHILENCQLFLQRNFALSKTPISLF